MSIDASRLRPGPTPGTGRGETRAEILRQAELIFAKVGFAGASLDMIADEVGIRRPSVLHHFCSKRDIFDQVEQAIFEELADRVDLAVAKHTAPFDRLLALLESWLGFMIARPSAARIVMRNSSDLISRGADPVQFSERVVAQFEAIIREGQISGDFRPTNPSLVMNMLGGGLMFYICNPEQLGTERHYDRADTRSLSEFRNLLRRCAAAMLLAGDCPGSTIPEPGQSLTY